jgi:glycosyltransferase involved in cell wall biosynthesis
VKGTSVELSSLPKTSVLLLSKEFLSRPQAGISVYTRNLARLLTDMGETCTILVCGPEGIQFNNDLNVWIISVEKSSEIILSMFEFRTPHPVAGWLKSAYEVASRYSIVFAPIVELQSRIFIKSFSGKTIASLHSPYGHFLPWNLIFRILQNRSIALSNFVVANSSAILDEFQLNETISIQKIPHVAFVETRVQPISENAGLVWIGTLTWRKGVDRLLRLLFSQKNSNIVVIYSRSRFDFISNKILIFFGRRCTLKINISSEELNQILDMSRALITTSRFESFGLVLSEAASRGRGIVGFRAPGVTETIPESCGGGIYVDNLKDLVDLTGNDKKNNDWTELGFQAQQYVRFHYSSAKISEKLMSLIH